MSLIDTRHHQLFPVLDAGQIETARRFASGPARDFAPGEMVFDVGERHAPAWLVLKGSIDVMRRDGLDREAAITTHHAGQFSGEVSQLAGRQSLASGPGGRGRLHRAALRCRACAGADGRLGGSGRDHDARLHPAPGRAHRGRGRRLGARRQAGHARTSPGSKASSAATAIPIPCSTPTRMPTAAP